jgi:DNA-binding transcriptional MocR family regulator
MRNWQPRISGGSAPVYERLIDALERDVRSGILASGDRLPPHRDLAHRLSLSVGTVSRAYVEAERRGIISSHVGRGSFIADRAVPYGDAARDALLDLSHNLPPLDPSERRISECLARIRKRPDLLDSVGYSPPEGFPAIRHAGAEWLKRRHRLSRARADTIIQCNGGQHGLALAFSALAQPGDTILCEAVTYPGIRTLADHAGYRLAGVAMDERGIEPEAIARAASQTGARVLVLIPTLQNPTTITLDAARRAEIVEVARTHDLMIVEDEAYRIFADPDCPPSFAELAPERTLMVAGLSKSIAPGLRVGFLLPPEGEGVRDRLILGIRAFGYSPPTFGGMIFHQWEQDGTADRIADEVIAEMEARTDLAVRILGDAVAVPGAARSLHVWLPMPAMDAERVSARALRDGVAVTPPDGPVVDPGGPSGLRLCLGSTRTREALEHGLRSVSAALKPGVRRNAHSLV